jgi:hypothetical protein
MSHTQELEDQLRLANIDTVNEMQENSVLRAQRDELFEAAWLMIGQVDQWSSIFKLDEINFSLEVICGEF